MERTAAVSERARVPARRGRRPAAPRLLVEQGCFEAGDRLVCGIDEVGRGAWAGPVSVGAVVIGPAPKRIQRVRDSKELTLEQREALYPKILGWALAAASIVAKVTRDRLMAAEAECYPGYDFDSNRGYPSHRHRCALLGYGPTAIHRRSWIYMENLPWAQPAPALTLFS